MATHSSVLACWIPGMGEPGGLPSMGSHRVGHYWSDLAAAAAPISMKTLTSASQPFHSKFCQHPRYSIRHQSLTFFSPINPPLHFIFANSLPLEMVHINHISRGEGKLVDWNFGGPLWTMLVFTPLYTSLPQIWTDQVTWVEQMLSVPVLKLMMYWKILLFALLE